MSKRKSRPAPADFFLPPVGVDSHLHLDLDWTNKKDTLAALERAKQAGVAEFGQVFLGPKAYHDRVDFFKESPEVFFILGIHPNDALEVFPTHLDLKNPAAGLERYLHILNVLDEIKEIIGSDKRVKAIGEIGLDFHWQKTPVEIQKKLFREQLLLAKELDLPVVIHSREAETDTLEILLEMDFSGRPVLWHCFPGGKELALAVNRHGWSLSVPGTITYPKNTILAEAVRAVNQDRLLLETDSPFLTPEPYRGKPCEPAYLVFTALKVAEILEMNPDELWRLTGQNARTFFRNT